MRQVSEVVRHEFRAARRHEFLAFDSPCLLRVGSVNAGGYGGKAFVVDGPSYFGPMSLLRNAVIRSVGGK